MTARPTVSPAFATAATFTSGTESGLAPRLDPGSGIKAQGIYPNRRMPARWFNWLVGLAGDWLQYLDEKTICNFSAKSFGAVGTGLVDDRAAIQSAIDACATAGGGFVYLPPGAYRIDSGLTLPKIVNLIGVRNGTVVVLNHATANLLTFGTGIDSGMPQLIEGIGFGGLVPNTGKVFTDAGSGGRSVVIRDCSVGDDDSNLQGQIGDFTGGSRVMFNNCELHVSGTAYGFRQSNTGGQLVIDGGQIFCPATYATYLVYYSLGGGSVRTKFDFSAHSSGSGATAIGVSSGSTTPVEIVGNRFVNLTGGPTKYALTADSNANVAMEGNTFGQVNRFNTVGLLTTGSRLELYPDANVSLVGNAYTVSTGVASTFIRFDVGSTAPTITLPPILFAGQELTLTIYNISGGTFGISIANYGVKASQPTLSNASGASALFVAGDPSATGVLSWCQVGAWGTVAP